MKNKRSRKEKSAGVLTLKNVAGMTEKGRKEIAAWLRRQADFMVKHGKEYTNGSFRARFIYK